MDSAATPKQRFLEAMTEFAAGTWVKVDGVVEPFDRTHVRDFAYGHIDSLEKLGPDDIERWVSERACLSAEELADIHVSIVDIASLVGVEDWRAILDVSVQVLFETWRDRVNHSNT